MKPSGVMVVTSNRFGLMKPLSQRANKNSEYAAVGKATLGEMGFFGDLPQYLLEEVGRWAKAGLDTKLAYSALRENLRTGGSHRELYSVLRAIRLNGGKAEGAKVTESRKITLPSEAWEVLEYYANMEGTSISEVASIFLMAGMKIKNG